MKSLDHFDVAIVGAGVIGLALAQRLSAAPFMANRSIVLLEQESEYGQHISSRNSEVIHAGIYYPADSLKASLCVRGRHLLYEHCEAYQIPHRKLGKLIVGAEADRGAIEALLESGLGNGVSDLELLTAAALAAREGALQASLALFSPSSGIIDAHSYMTSLLHLAQHMGVLYAPRTRVEAVTVTDTSFQVDTTIDTVAKQPDPAPLQVESYRFRTTALVNCTGLDTANVARRIDRVPAQCIPDLYLCKGDYFTYRRASPFRHLIYPIPERNTAGLGIHSTLDMGGQLRFGPDTEYVDDIDYSINPAKSQKFAAAIRRYFPVIDESDLAPGYAGIRPKLVGSGQSAADFVIQTEMTHGVPGLVQLFGIESPGLTASLALADYVCDHLRQSL